MTKNIFRNLSLIVILMISITSISYAFWDQLKTEDDQIIGVGVGANLIINVEVAETGKYLIPIGAIKGLNDVDVIELSFLVRLSKNLNDDLNLIVFVENITIGGKSDYSNLVVVDIEKTQENINDSDIRVLVYVKLNMPESLEVYEQIVGKKITFDLRFTAEKKLE